MPQAAQTDTDISPFSGSVVRSWSQRSSCCSAVSSQQAFAYYVSEYTRSGIQSANNWYGAIQKGWENTSFLDGATVQPPALFLTGELDPSLKPMFGLDRYGPALQALQTTSANIREVITLPAVGHTPPERPKEINAIVLNFLKDIDF